MPKQTFQTEGDRSSGLRIRIRSVFGYRWIWELLGPDRHIVNTSPEFATREECEADALRQGDPVEGLRKAAKARAKRPTADVPSPQYFPDDAGMWRWELRTPSGDVIEGSRWAFLTREECEADFSERTPSNG
jgi:hypothetical protein